MVTPEILTEEVVCGSQVYFGSRSGAAGEALVRSALSFIRGGFSITVSVIWL